MKINIKPLEWEPGFFTTSDDDNGPREGIPRNLHAWRSDRYTIILQDSPGGLYLVRGLSAGTGLAVPTITEAKAAAQADFESRILAALDTAPTPDPAQIRREALREAVAKLEEREIYFGADLVRGLITGGDDDAA